MSARLGRAFTCRSQRKNSSNSRSVGLVSLELRRLMFTEMQNKPGEFPLEAAATSNALFKILRVGSLEPEASTRLIMPETTSDGTCPSEAALEQATTMFSTARLRFLMKRISQPTHLDKHKTQLYCPLERVFVQRACCVPSRVVPIPSKDVSCSFKGVLCSFEGPQ